MDLYCYFKEYLRKYNCSIVEYLFPAPFKYNVDQINKLTLKYNDKQNMYMNNDSQKDFASSCDY